MSASEGVGGSVGTPGWGTPFTRAQSAVRDDALLGDGLILVVDADDDRLDLDGMEHTRQNRLKRWQKPPVPTRKATH